MIIKIKKPLTKAKLDQAEKLMTEKRGKVKGFNAKKFSGKLKGVFGDPLEYQKKVRNEWT
ncbi:MAG: hypothetical protein ABI663_12435 [Chryseolinea sp.]